MKKFAAVVVASGALLVPGSALASGTCQKNSSSTYETNCNHVGSVQDTGASRSTTPSTSSPSATSSSPTVNSVNSDRATRSASTASSELPFTGIDIVPLAAGGALLLGAGLFVRRLSAENSEN